MKNLKCLVLGLSFTLLTASVTSNAFASVTKHNIKLGDEAFKIFTIAEKEFKMGQKFQDKKDFENALICYAKSLESWSSDEVYFKLTSCLYLNKYYHLAERMTFAGLLCAKQKGDLKNHFRFLALLADIYFETGNFNKALSIYEHLSKLPMKDKSRYLIERRIGTTLFNIIYP